jgi:hypothetical protein
MPYVVVSGDFVLLLLVNLHDQASFRCAKCDGVLCRELRVGFYNLRCHWNPFSKFPIDET